MEKKKLWAAIVGYGNRGQVYADYSLDCPEEFGVAAVIDPNEFKLREARARYRLTEGRLFRDFAAFAASGIACEDCGGQRIRPGVLSLLRRAERGELSEEGEDPDFYRGAVRLLSYHLANVAEGAEVLEDYLAALKKIS